jgi:hypothetical protein
MGEVENNRALMPLLIQYLNEFLKKLIPLEGPTKYLEHFQRIHGVLFLSLSLSLDPVEPHQS